MARHNGGAAARAAPLLRQEGFRVLECIGDSLRYGRGEFNPPLGLVRGDLH
jgi:hypothetical protein